MADVARAFAEVLPVFGPARTGFVGRCGPLRFLGKPRLIPAALARRRSCAWVWGLLPFADAEDSVTDCLSGVDL